MRIELFFDYDICSIILGRIGNGLPLVHDGIKNRLISYFSDFFCKSDFKTLNISWVDMLNIYHTEEAMMKIASNLYNPNKFYSEFFSKGYYKYWVSDFQILDYHKAINNALGEINKRLTKYAVRVDYVNECLELTNYDEDYVIIDSDVSHFADNKFIRQLPLRIESDLKNGFYEGVVTKCRTMIEEVLIYIIKESGEIPPATNGDLSKLYSQCKLALGINHKSNEVDKQLEIILKGINTVIIAIGKLRNKNSDSHGATEDRVEISRAEAKLIANSAISVCEFFYDVFIEKNNQN